MKMFHFLLKFKRGYLCALFVFFVCQIKAQEGNIWHSQVYGAINKPYVFMNFNYFPAKIELTGTRRIYKYYLGHRPTLFTAANQQGQLMYFTSNSKIINSNFDSIGFLPQSYGENVNSIFWKNDSILVEIGIEAELAYQSLDTLRCDFCYGQGTSTHKGNLFVYELNTKTNSVKKQVMPNSPPIVIPGPKFPADSFMNVQYYGNNVQTHWDSKLEVGYSAYQIMDSVYFVFFDKNLIAKKILKQCTVNDHNIIGLGYTDAGRAQIGLEAYINHTKISPSGKKVVLNFTIETFSGYIKSLTQFIDVDFVNQSISENKIIFADSTKNGFRWGPFCIEFGATDTNLLMSFIQYCHTYNNGYICAKTHSKLVYITLHNNSAPPEFLDIVSSILPNRLTIPDSFYTYTNDYKSIKFGPDGKFYIIKMVFQGDVRVQNPFHPIPSKSSTFPFLLTLENTNKKWILTTQLDLAKTIVGTNGIYQLRKLEFDAFWTFPETPGPYKRVMFNAKNNCNKETWLFTNTSDTQYFVKYRWYFSETDSAETTNKQIAVSHRFTSIGKYLVRLRAFNSAGGWIWYGDSIEVKQNPIARFGIEQKPGCQWIAYTFTDSSIFDKARNNYTWRWNFGDGSADSVLRSKTLPMPTKGKLKHTYTQNGKFTATLIITDSICYDTLQKVSNVEILPAPRPGIACTPVSGCTPLKTDFKRQYTDAVDSMHWQISKNKVLLKGQPQQYVYAKPGGYWLYQTLYGNTGCVTRDSMHLQVNKGFDVGTLPYLANATLLSNSQTKVWWTKVQFAKNYELQLNGKTIANTTDTFYLQSFGNEIQTPLKYEVIAKDSCGTASTTSNVGRTLFLKATQTTSTDKAKFGPALVTWNPYIWWQTGVKEYRVESSFDPKTEPWVQIANGLDTSHTDIDFVQQNRHTKCYRVVAESNNEIESKSNELCLNYEPVMFIPNAITPNGDGLNDNLNVVNYGFEKYTIMVFNSWGQKVFESTQTNEPWKPDASAMNGVYAVKILAYSQGKEYMYRSTVEVVR